ncbi:MAG: putative head completion protein [Prokaryotic dsDNA virus sp.]|nr:MAG: putative head completion protein [Prokaryotic dsDNA virus sp.]|tara:strand:+ start:1652 stop:1993 length:342 start_codon:yes stop_codon:yes gene_type:complete
MAKQFQPGKLNKRIQFLDWTTIDDGFGGLSESSVSVVATVWAHVKEVRSTVNDLTKHGEVGNRVETEFYIRKKAVNIQDDFLIRFNSKDYRINAFYDSELDYYIKIIATIQDD